MENEAVVTPPETKPRPTRQGFKNYRWPKEYLATIYAIFESAGENNNACSELVKEYLPDLEMDYAMTTGRPITNNAIYNRYDKANRYGEYRNYEHLLSEVRETVQTWLTDKAEVAVDVGEAA